jgi:hypothetical protein
MARPNPALISAAHFELMARIAEADVALGRSEDLWSDFFRSMLEGWHPAALRFEKPEDAIRALLLGREMIERVPDLQPKGGR